MGTKVQCESYMPGYHPMRDLNQNTSSSWSSYYVDKTSSGHLYNGFTLQSVNGHSEYDKEVVKRTMLEHEAIFRKQVYELHRLYRIQKDLTDELKRKEFLRYSVPMDTSQSNSISSQMPLEGAKTKWQMPQAPAVNTFSNGGSVTRPSDTRVPQNLIEETSGRLSEPGTKTLPKRMFDLQLPADVYIDSEEDAQTTEREDVSKSFFGATNSLSRIREFVPENNVKLSLGPDEDPSRNVCWKAEAKSQSDLPIHSFADLNEPAMETCYEELTVPPTHFFGTRTHLEENQGHHLLKLDTKAAGLYRNFFQDMRKDKGTCSNFFSEIKDDMKQHWGLLDDGTGPSRSMSSFNETFPMSYDAIQSKLKKTRDTLFPDQKDYNERWFKEKPIGGIDIPEMRPHLVNPNNSGPTPSKISGLFSLPPQMASSSRTPEHGMNHFPVAVQALPCFNGSATNLQNKSYDTNLRNTDRSCDKGQYNADLRLKEKFGCKPSSYQNGFNPPFTLSKADRTMHNYESAYGNSDDHGSQKFFKIFKCSDVKSSAKDVNLNPVHPNGDHGRHIAQPDTMIRYVNSNHKEESGVLSWIKTRPSCNRSAELEQHTSEMLFGFSPSQGYSQPFPTDNTVILDIQMRCEKEKRSSPYIIENNLSAWREKEIDLNTVADPMVEKSVGKKPIAVRKHINLNLDLPDMSETLHEDEANVITSVMAKIALKIDLEAPISSHMDESTLPRGQFTRKAETECSPETVIRAAAENIIALTKDKCFCSDSYCRPLASSSRRTDSLHWFAEVVSSKAEWAEGLIGGSDDEGSDSFEALILKLEEIKTDEYWFSPMEQEMPKDDEKSAASLLTKLRRGQGRRRRQRRDFQKDILPGLASLSRHEVTEDLQALMRASGNSWQAGVSRRGTSRKPRGKAGTGAKTRAASQMPAPTTNVELEKGDETNIIGWGRTTRRCRRQRCPTVNVTTTLT